MRLNCRLELIYSHPKNHFIKILFRQSKPGWNILTHAHRVGNINWWCGWLQALSSSRYSSSSEQCNVDTRRANEYMAGTGLRCWVLLTDNFFSLFSRSFLSQTKAQIKIKMTNPVKLPPSALNAGEPMTKFDFPGGSLSVVLFEFELSTHDVSNGSPFIAGSVFSHSKTGRNEFWASKARDNVENGAFLIKNSCSTLRHLTMSRDRSYT